MKLQPQVAHGASGVGVAASPLVKVDPERYGSLVHPGDDYSYEMFTQAALVLRHPGAVDPLGGLTAARLIGDGESQSAFRMVTYVDAIQPVRRAFDGFFIHSRSSGSTPLAAPADAGIAGFASGPTPAHIRGDLAVPVLQFETETDLLLLGFSAARQPDAAGLRTWEVAGTAHADQYLLDYESNLATDAGASDAGSLSIPCSGVNAGPEHWVVNTALNAIHTWVKAGQAPASGTPLTLADAGSAFAQDAYGNALGGVRTAAVDVPIATYSGQGDGSNVICELFGTTTPFSSTQLATLYSSHDDYVAKVTAATVKSQQAGFILPADAPLIEEEAQSAPVPQ